MITISKATVEDVFSIQKIANQTWPIAYGAIISQTQINYMLDLFYSDSALKDSMTKKGHLFVIAKENGSCLGFAGFENQYLAEKITRLHKLYILPNSQGKGIGKLLMKEVEKSALENQSKCISLNVNKYNTALHFYLDSGFEIIKEEIIDIGSGFIMDDYVMELKL